jgi:hypothetical protein
MIRQVPVSTVTSYETRQSGFDPNTSPAVPDRQSKSIKYLYVYVFIYILAFANEVPVIYTRTHKRTARVHIGLLRQLT